MAEELWVEGAGGKRGPEVWQRVGVDRGGVGRVGGLGKAMGWEEGVAVGEGVWGVRQRGLGGVGAVGRGIWWEERASGQRGPVGRGGGGWRKPYD